MIYRSNHTRAGLSRYRLAWMLWLSLLLAPAARSAEFSPPLTNVAQLLALDGPLDDARQAARLKAVVTYYEPRRRLLVVQDHTGGILVRTRHSELALARGQEVELDGVAGRHGREVMLDQAVIRTVKEGRLPACIPATIATVSRGQYDGLRVEIRGVVRLLDSNGSRPVLHLHDGPADLDVLLRDSTRKELSPKTWVDAEVVVQGVPYTITDDEEVPAGLYFLTDGLKDVDVEKPPLERPFSINAITIAQALATNSSHRVKLMGRATAPPDTNGWLTINDSTGDIRLRRADRSPVLAGDLVEALGFPDGPTGAAYIDHAQLRVIEASSRYKTTFTNDPGMPVPPHLPVLFTITEARSLPLEKAKLGFPVRVRGVVTFQEREAGYLFIHDGRQGICVAPLADPGPLPPGDIVEVTGNSDVGTYAPTVVDAQIKRVARGDLPLPREPSLSEMMTGREDCQWVTVEGVVRESGIYQKQLWIKLAVNGGIVSAIVPVPEGPATTPASLILRSACVRCVARR